MSDSTLRKLELLFRIVAVLAAGFFFLSGTAYLWFGHWPVTHQDFWRIYDICLNQSWFASATLKYNGHSHFFPSQIWLMDLRFFHGNQEVLFVAGFGLLCLSVALLVTPIWQDATTETTAKVAGTLLLVVGNWWMGRASMTVSGGFNCCYSLTLAGAALAFWWLPAMSEHSTRRRLATFIVISAGVVSSFSFGTGLAIWPTVLLAGYCLRLRTRSLVCLAFAAIAVVVVFLLLPAREPGSHPPAQAIASHISALANMVCRLIGSPASYAAAGWSANGRPQVDIQYSALPLLFGAAGLVGSLLIVLFTVIRKNAGTNRLQFTGFGLMVFNLCAILLIAVGREDHIRLLPAEVAAPRYLFWSSLFWAGLFIVVLNAGWSRAPLRWLGLLLLLAVPVLLFPSQYKEGQHWRFARCSSIAAATSLINGVRDEEKIRILFRSPDVVYRLAAQLRARRLDMFAGEPAHWIGRRESDLFQGRLKPVHLRGRARIDASVHSLNGGPAARVKGWASERGSVTPAVMLIVDGQGTIQGIARSCAMSPLLNRILYRGMFSTRSFLGYICNYDPRQLYTIRAVDDGVLSSEGILVDPELTGSAVPNEQLGTAGLRPPRLLNYWLRNASVIR